LLGGRGVGWDRVTRKESDNKLKLGLLPGGSISGNVLISVPSSHFLFFLAFALKRKTKGVLMSGARRGALKWSVLIRSPCDNKRQEPIIQWFERICTRAGAVVAALHACH
jgi:hypothetical protein